MLPGSFRKFCRQSMNNIVLTPFHSEEEDPDEYPFPLTLRSKKPNGAQSPYGGAQSPSEYTITNGNGLK